MAGIVGAPRVVTAGSAVALLLAGAVLAGCDQQTAASAPTPVPPTVTVAHPLAKKITEWDEYTGRFDAVDDVELRARVSGYLESVHFKDGQIVKKGDLLFVIDPRPFQIAVDQAKADLAGARARQQLAAIELERAAQLLGASNVSRSTYDQRLQEKESADAAVAAADAALRKAELDLEYTQITAPIDGRTSNRRVDVGNLVLSDGTGPTLLTTIVSLDPIYFVFDVSEADYLRYQRLDREGRRQSSRDVPNPVYVRLADERGWPRQGHMDFVDNVVDRSTGTIRARAVFANPDYALTPGVFGRLRLLGSGEHEVIMIPDEAVVSDQARKLVMTVAADGTVQPRPVTLGPIVDGLRIVRDGLTADDTVVINGLLRARPGAKVTAQPGSFAPEAGPG